MNVATPAAVCLRGGRCSHARVARTFVIRVIRCTSQGHFRAFHASPARHDIKDIRNIGIIAHVDAGKTTTTERMLFDSGATRHLGNVDHGDTVTDFLPLERERGITIQSAAITFQWPARDACPPGSHPRTINLIDTPGHQDFRFEVDRCMPVLDGAVCVVDAVKGVEAHTERVWRSAHEFAIPRIMFVNKMDRDGASFRRAVVDVAVKLNAWPVACQIPWWDKDRFIGVVDVVGLVGYEWRSRVGVDGKPVCTKHDYLALKEMLAAEDPAFLAEMETAREKLVEGLCLHDDALMDVFLEKGSGMAIAPPAIKESIRRGIGDGSGAIVPMFAGSSLRNMGVEPLLDAVVDYLPSPADRPDLEISVDGTARHLSEVLAQKLHNSKHTAGSQLAGLASVFKVVNDAQRGMLTFVRVYHGTLAKSASMWNSNVRQFERPLGLVQVAAAKANEVAHLATGHIGAVTGLKAARTGDTLVSFHGHHGHKSAAPPDALRGLRIRPAEVPPAVTFLAIEPRSVTEAKEVEAALASITREDPSLRWSKDEEREQYVLSGMGRLHLEVAQDHLRTRYGVRAAAFSAIEVDYKECLTAPTGPHRVVFERSVAGRAGKAACTASLEPLPPPSASSSSPPHQDDDDPLVLESTVERDGNLIHISLPLPSPPATADPSDPDAAAPPPPPSPSSLPFDADVVRAQLLNGAIAALARGPRRGSPVQGLRVRLTYDARTDHFGEPGDGGGGAHLVGAATKAVGVALREAQLAGNVGVLEPVMRAVITCPEAVAGTVQHDITSGRGGHVLQVRDPEAASSAAAAGSGAGRAPPDGEDEAVVDVSQVYAPPDPYEALPTLKQQQQQQQRGRKGGVARQLEIVAQVPLKEMLEYDAHLRSMTGGRHSVLMELDSFQRVHGNRERGL